MNLEDLSSLILQLTDSAIGLSLDDHQTGQIEVLQKAIPFDAAWWGWSNFSGGRNRLINTGLFNLPQSYDSAIRAVLHLDPFVKTGRNLSIYGKTIDAETDALPHDYRKTLEAFHIRSILNGHCRFQGDSEFNFFLSLYKTQAGQAFSETDSRTYRLILRHIEQNLSLSLRAELRSLAPKDGEAAIVSEGGAVVRATRGFRDKLRDACANGTKIDALLTDMSFGLRHWMGGDVVLESTRYEPGLVLLRLSPNSLLARLSPQEQQVAEALMLGKSMREIAVERRVSHNTVRNQVAAIYKKAGTKNRVSFLTKAGFFNVNS